VCPGRVRLPSTLVAFFMKAAIKAATLLARAVFASVNSSGIGLVRSKNSSVVNKLRIAATTSFRIDMTAIKPGAVGINQGH